MFLGRIAGNTILVGGTNGKGSVVALLESIYLAAGYSVGSYTSPHLLHYNERVHLGGVEVSDQQLCDAFNTVETARADTQLTYFEFGTLAAAHILQSQNPDVAILEVGLGGRLDAVNLFDADVAIVTTVDIDHSDWLGEDRESIGYEKAGIFRAGKPAICGDIAPPSSLVKTADDLGAELYVQGRDFSFDCEQLACRFHGGGLEWTGLPQPRLAGQHQRLNVASTLMAVASLQPRLPVTRVQAIAAIAGTEVVARFQIVATEPEVILDVAHNPQAVRALARTCGERAVKGRTIAVVGMMRDKAIAECLGALGAMVDKWFLASLPGPRGADASVLADALLISGIKEPHEQFADVTMAYHAALSHAKPEDRILVFGSFVTVGAIMHALN